MTATLRLDGDARGAVQATSAVSGGVRKMGDDAKRTESIFEESNRKIIEQLKKQKTEIDSKTASVSNSSRTIQQALATEHELVRRNAADFDQFGKRVDGVRVAQTRAFGGGALATTARYFTTLFGPTALIGGAIAGLRAYNAELDAVGQSLQGNRAGLGQLMQLAAVSKDPKGTKNRLVAESMSLWKSGATNSIGEAGDLVFTLESANITDPKQRKRIGDMLANGVIPEAKQFSASIAALRSAFPNLTPDKLTGMGIVAAIPSPGGAEQIIQHAGKSGEQLRALGWKPEFGLAATSVLSRTYGGASEGGVRLEQFMKQLEHHGYQADPTLKGLDPFETIARIQTATGGDRAKLEKYVGNRMEALQGYRTLQNRLAEVKDLTAAAGGADSRVVDTALGLARDTPEIDAARQAIASRNTRAASRLGGATTAELYGAFADERAAGRGWLGSAAVNFDYYSARFLGEGAQNYGLRKAVNDPDYAKDMSPELLEAIRRHLASIDGKTDSLPAATGRAEK